MISNVVGLIAKILFEWWGWVPIVVYFGYQIWQNQRRIKAATNAQYTVLLLEIPLISQRTENYVEHLINRLHSILRPKAELIAKGILQEHISLEVVATQGFVRFYIWTPQNLLQFVHEAVEQYLPGIKLYEVADYSSRELDNQVVQGLELELEKPDIHPVKNYHEFSQNPMSHIMSSLSDVAEDEEVWLQVLCRPIDGSWKHKGEMYAKAHRSPESTTGGGLVYILKGFFGITDEGGEAKLSDTRNVERKIERNGFQVKIRLLYLGNDQSRGVDRLASVIDGFSIYKNPGSNAFKPKKLRTDILELRKFKSRYFIDDGYILNTEEIASVWHPPYTLSTTAQISNAIHEQPVHPQTTSGPAQIAPQLMPAEQTKHWVQQTTNTSPLHVPFTDKYPEEEIIPLGLTKVGDINKQFGILRKDRKNHILVTGNKGGGKSSIMKLLALNDMYYGYGCAIIDTRYNVGHDFLKRVPANRIDDVIFFDLTDKNYPPGFNPLDFISYDLSARQATFITESLKQWFTLWNDQIEICLLYAVEALINKQATTLLDIPRLLTDENYRLAVALESEQPNLALVEFLTSSYNQWFNQNSLSAIRPLISQLEQMFGQKEMRRVFCQTENDLDIESLINNQQILIANMPPNEVGDIANVASSLLLSEIHLRSLAMESKNDFYIFIEEIDGYPNTIVDKTIMESQLTKLSLCYGSRTLSGVQPKLLNNLKEYCGTQIMFNSKNYSNKNRLGAFTQADVNALKSRQFIISETVAGHIIPTFAANCLSLPQPDPANDYSAYIIDRSRQLIGENYALTDKKITTTSNKTRTSQSGPPDNKGTRMQSGNVISIR